MKNTVLLTLACLLAFSDFVAGGCEFSSSVCTTCADTANATSQSDCAEAIFVYCNQVNWTDAACASIEVPCPFALNGTEGPVSPCEAPACILGNGTDAEQACMKIIEEYCTFQEVHSAIHQGFVSDLACKGFWPIGCAEGQVRDCNGACAALVLVHNGVCNNATGANFSCPAFEYDGGDCSHIISSTCLFADVEVCAACDDLESAACASALATYCKYDNAPGCNDLKVPCPFANSSSSRPQSPCESGACLGADVATCTAAVDVYCTYHIVNNITSSTFSADPACVGYRGPGCNEHELLDCNGICFPLTTLQNGECNNGTNITINWDCKTFEYDGGDCGSCAFTDMSVCGVCNSDTPDSCTRSVIDHCLTSDDLACANINVDCVFWTNSSSGPMSPCNGWQCSGTSGVWACFELISEYCTYHLTQPRLTPGFVADPACDAFTPVVCKGVAVFDCAGNCATPSTLGDGVCNTGANNSANWMCSQFSYDAGDCACEFGNYTVCEVCNNNRTSEACSIARAEQCLASNHSTCYVACPFGNHSSEASRPVSPCVVEACAADSNHTACAAAISAYCTYDLVHARLNASFVTDKACADFSPIGCDGGSVRNCNGNCQSLSTLRNGECNPGWQCSAFNYDGGDCANSTQTNSSHSVSLSHSASASASASASVPILQSVSPSASATISTLIKSEVHCLASLQGVTVTDFNSPDVTHSFKSAVAEKSHVNENDVHITDVHGGTKKQVTIIVEFYILVLETEAQNVSSILNDQTITSAIVSLINAQLQTANSTVVILDVSVNVTAVFLASASASFTPSLSSSPSVSRSLRSADGSSSDKNQVALIVGVVVGVGTLLIAVAAVVVIRENRKRVVPKANAQPVIHTQWDSQRNSGAAPATSTRFKSEFSDVGL